jgi:hypothetical protein
MSDKDIEQQIQAKPRRALRRVIKECHYLNVGEAVQAGWHKAMDDCTSAEPRFVFGAAQRLHRHGRKRLRQPAKLRPGDRRKIARENAADLDAGRLPAETKASEHVPMMAATTAAKTVKILTKSQPNPLAFLFGRDSDRTPR